MRTPSRAAARTRSRWAYASGYAHGFALLTVFCLAAAVAALLVPVRRTGRPTGVVHGPEQPAPAAPQSVRN